MPVSSARLDSSAEAEDRDRISSSLVNSISVSVAESSLRPRRDLTFCTSSLMIDLSCVAVSFMGVQFLVGVC